MVPMCPQQNVHLYIYIYIYMSKFNGKCGNLLSRCQNEVYFYFHAELLNYKIMRSTEDTKLHVKHKQQLMNTDDNGNVRSKRQVSQKATVAEIVLDDDVCDGIEYKLDVVRVCRYCKLCVDVLCVLAPIQPLKLLFNEGTRLLVRISTCKHQVTTPYCRFICWNYLALQ